MTAFATRESTRSLVFANAVTLLLALLFRWPIEVLLWPYWVQSVIIGYFSRKRILALENFSTEGVVINDEPVEPTEETKKSTAGFFMLHYGFFHLGYAVFIASWSGMPGRWDWIGLAIAAVTFAWNHYYSYRQNIEADAAGRPNIGTLMFLPYLRVVPMHLTILAAGAFMGRFSVMAIVVFIVLKTAADVAMHHFEHKLLQRN